MSEAVTLKFTVDIECEKCGRHLDVDVQRDTIYVTPCGRCMENEYERGLREAEVE